MKESIALWFKYVLYDSVKPEFGVYEDNMVLSKNLYLCSQALVNGVNVFLDTYVRGTHFSMFICD